MSLGPRPMYSCSKRLIPLQITASISPWVFIVTANVSSFPVAGPQGRASARSASAAVIHSQARQTGDHDTKPGHHQPLAFAALGRTIRLSAEPKWMKSWLRFLLESQSSAD